MKKYLYSFFIAVVFSLFMGTTAFAANELEPNDKKDNATEMLVNSGITGAMSDDDDVDWYKFTTTSDGKITLSFEHDVISSTNRYWYMYLYQSDGVTCINSWAVYGKDTTTSTCEIGLKAGTYYVKVEPYSYSSKTYTLKVNYQCHLV